MSKEIESFIKNLQQQIEQQKTELFELKTIINSIPGSIYWKDVNGKYLGRNLYATGKMIAIDLLHQDIESVIGKTDYDLFAIEVAEQYRKHDLYVIETGKEFAIEEILTTPNNEIITQLSTKSPLRDAYGNIIGVIGNTIDISYLKKIEKDLEKTKERLEASTKIKDAFIHNMEHDIRTPFVGILGLSNYLFEQEEDITKKEYLNDIAMSARQLLNYCNCILDYANVEMDSIPIVEKKFFFKELIDNLIIAEKPAAIIKKLTLSCQYDDKIPKLIIGDQYRLQRILINLISNAIKFTCEGTITVETKLKRTTEREVVISIIVKDTGIGVPEDKINYIYEKFYRSTPANKGTYSGLGLGLKIVKHFVNELGGEIEVKSKPNKGSIFSCTFPFKLPLVEEILYE